MQSAFMDPSDNILKLGGGMCTPTPGSEDLSSFLKTNSFNVSLDEVDGLPSDTQEKFCYTQCLNVSSSDGAGTQAAAKSKQLNFLSLTSAPTAGVAVEWRPNAVHTQHRCLCHFSCPLTQYRASSIPAKQDETPGSDYQMTLWINCAAKSTKVSGALEADTQCNPSNYDPWPAREALPFPPYPPYSPPKPPYSPSPPYPPPSPAVPHCCSEHKSSACGTTTRRLPDQTCTDTTNDLSFLGCDAFQSAWRYESGPALYNLPGLSATYGGYGAVTTLGACFEACSQSAECKQAVCGYAPPPVSCSTSHGETTPCCNQPKSASRDTPEHICPATAPYCTGYVVGKSWGTCGAAGGSYTLKTQWAANSACACYPMSGSHPKTDSDGMGGNNYNWASISCHSQPPPPPQYTSMVAAQQACWNHGCSGLATSSDVVALPPEAIGYDASLKQNCIPAWTSDYDIPGFHVPATGFPTACTGWPVGWNLDFPIHGQLNITKPAAAWCSGCPACSTISPSSGLPTATTSTSGCTCVPDGEVIGSTMQDNMVVGGTEVQCTAQTCQEQNMVQGPGETCCSKEYGCPTVTHERSYCAGGERQKIPGVTGVPATSFDDALSRGWAFDAWQKCKIWRFDMIYVTVALDGTYTCCLDNLGALSDPNVATYSFQDISDLHSLPSPPPSPPPPPLSFVNCLPFRAATRLSGNSDLYAAASYYGTYSALLGSGGNPTTLEECFNACGWSEGQANRCKQAVCYAGVSDYDNDPSKWQANSPCSCYLYSEYTNSDATPGVAMGSDWQFASIQCNPCLQNNGPDGDCCVSSSESPGCADGRQPQAVSESCGSNNAHTVCCADSCKFS
jgi:hypothetical protein